MNTKQKYTSGFMLAKGMLLTGLCAGILMSLCSCNKLILTRDGKTAYTIVQAENATEPEKYAVQELTNFLSRVTGASFPVVLESSLPAKMRGIYVGWTKYASQNGIDAAKLGEEEWIIRSVEKNLVLTGGRPRGTLYAVYEFLERQIGCHWLDENTDIVPSKPALTLDKLDIRGEPWFWRRQFMGQMGHQPAVFKYLVRNKNYRSGIFSRGQYSNEVPQGLLYRLDGSPGFCHTFSFFVNASNWFASHPEYFSLDSAGKRVPAYDGAGPGQLCLTHPDVRRLTLEKLREYIAKDRAEAAAKGCPPPRIYMIGHNDKYDAHCKCTNCQAIAKREGSESGPLIDFINAVAEDIEKDYPDILISTHAYNQTSTPPKTIKPRQNVMISWCDVYSVCDILRPLSHPYNARNYKEITGWSKIAPQIAIGDDYWSLQSLYPAFPFPWTMVQCVGPDLKLFADCGAKTFFSEASAYLDAGENFIPLKMWLAYQLLVNPYQPVEPLIKTFIDGYYGAAAPAMNGYLAYLQGRIDKEAEFMMTRDAPHNLKYLDLDFFVTARRLFDDADARVKPGSLEARHVLRERFVVDSALLYLWPWLDRKLPRDKTMPFDHEALIERFKEGWRSYAKYWFNVYYSPGNANWYNKDGKRMDRIVALFRDPKLPEPFRSFPPRDVCDFNWLTFPSYCPSQRFVVDNDAVGGMAAEPAGMSAIQAAEKGAAADGTPGKEYTKPLSFGVTGVATMTLKPDEIPQDEKYHLYKIGWITVKKKTTVWVLEGKKLGVNVDRLWVTNAIDPAVNEWNAYISLKIKGAAYVKGSTNANTVWMDRVLLVKPQPGEKPDAVELQRQEEKKKQDARRPQARVPQAPKGAGGDPLKVDWDMAVKGGAWSTLMGKDTARKVEARFTQDGDYLYIRLTEEVKAESLVNDAGIFGGDDWELLFAAKRGEPYRQIGINPNGEHKELAYGESSLKWESGVNVISECGSNLWKVSFSFPLNRLLPGGAKPGQSIYANILRGGNNPLAWSPTFEDGFNLQLDCLGEIVLE